MVAGKGPWMGFTVAGTGSVWRAKPAPVVTPTDASIFGGRSCLASTFEKSLAVSSIAVKVAASSPNWREPLNMDALPSKVRPAKQNNRCTQNT